MGRVTIKDIAKQAGVTASTVSCILNKKNLPFKRETVERVNRIAKELGYVVNVAAVNLVKGKTNTIGVLFVGNTDEPFNNRFIFSIISSLANHINKSSFNMYFSSSTTHESLEDLQEHINDMFLSGRVDGVVIVGPPDIAYHDYFRRFESKIPYVLIGRIDGTRRMNMVDVDNFEMGYQAVQYLSGAGAKHIGLLVPELNHQFNKDRIEGAKESARQLGLDLREENCLIGDGKNYEAMLPNLQEIVDRVDGIYCWDPYFAFHMFSYAVQQNKIPGRLTTVLEESLLDTRVFGVESAYMKIDTKKIGEMAARMIKEKIAEEKVHYSQVFIPPIVAAPDQREK